MFENEKGNRVHGKILKIRREREKKKERNNELSDAHGRDDLSNLKTAGWIFFLFSLLHFFCRCHSNDFFFFVLFPEALPKLL